jgi:hypothetical protein
MPPTACSSDDALDWKIEKLGSRENLRIVATAALLMLLPFFCGLPGPLPAWAAPPPAASFSGSGTWRCLLKLVRSRLRFWICPCLMRTRARRRARQPSHTPMTITTPASPSTHDCCQNDFARPVYGVGALVRPPLAGEGGGVVLLAPDIRGKFRGLIALHAVKVKSHSALKLRSFSVSKYSLVYLRF